MEPVIDALSTIALVAAHDLHLLIGSFAVLRNSAIDAKSFNLDNAHTA